MFFERTNEGYLLRIRVSPNASRCAIKGMFADASGAEFLKIALVAVPEKGKANQELIKYLSQQLKVAKGLFRIVSGETDKYKKIALTVAHDERLEEMFYQMERGNDSSIGD
jgi:hypothetical protein